MEELEKNQHWIISYRCRNLQISQTQYRSFLHTLISIVSLTLTSQFLLISMTRYIHLLFRRPTETDQDVNVQTFRTVPFQLRYILNISLLSVVKQRTHIKGRCQITRRVTRIITGTPRLGVCTQFWRTFSHRQLAEAFRTRNREKYQVSTYNITRIA